jgi:iron complex outermembrane receptor protein
VEGDLVRQQWVFKNQWGWNPTLTVESDRHDFTVGGSVYYFESDHWGQTVWAQHIGGMLPPQHKYYQYYGKKWLGSFFARVHSRLTERLSSQATAQLRFQRYKFDQVPMDPFVGYDYDLDWFFFSPRFGLNYALDEQASLFTNFAVSSRTPTDASIYDANDPYLEPSLDIKNERVYDLELGGRYRSGDLSAELNLFWMDFRNEILPYGGLNENTGLPITINADRSVHAGIELSAAAKLSAGLTLNGNFAFNHNRVKEYLADLDGFEVDFKDKTLTNFPDYLGNLITDWHSGAWRVTNRVRFVGRRYMELYNIETLSLDPFAVSSLTVQYSLKDFLSLGGLAFMIRVDNLGDKKYESSGYGGNYAYDDGSAVVIDGWAEYYVAPERSVYAQMKLEMF